MNFKKKQVTLLISGLFILLNISSITAGSASFSFHTNQFIQKLEQLEYNSREIKDTINVSYNTISTYPEKTALILNPSEYLYGKLHCQLIINNLHTNGYQVTYLSNEAVDLSFIKTNLAAEIVYINTHAGYFDIDGDNISETVVIATGELWTEETPQKYQFEYENDMIVEGSVGDKSFIAFTPALIEYYYDTGDFPDSLIYMATCFASYDDSMAQVFLDKGASAYMGWNQNTVFWTNSLTSIKAFRLFLYGYTVEQVCNLIRSGGIINFFLQSKLTYYGDGTHKMLIL